MGCFEKIIFNEKSLVAFFLKQNPCVQSDGRAHHPHGQKLKQSVDKKRYCVRYKQDFLTDVFPQGN